MSSVTYGKRVTGEKEHAAAVAANAGGSEVFGKRVRGALGANNPDEVAKAASEFGVRTLQGAHASNTKGQSSTVSIEELEALMDVATGNIPSMFDSLYENELGLEGGPRKKALEIFLVAEIGIKGAARLHTINQIRSLLGLDKEAAKRASENIDARQEALRGMEQRTEENKKLKDVPRLKALREREENLKFAESSSRDTTRGQATPLSMDGQVKQAEDSKKADDKSDDDDKETSAAARKSAATKQATAAKKK